MAGGVEGRGRRGGGRGAPAACSTEIAQQPAPNTPVTGHLPPANMPPSQGWLLMHSINHYYAVEFTLSIKRRLWMLAVWQCLIPDNAYGF